MAVSDEGTLGGLLLPGFPLPSASSLQGDPLVATRGLHDGLTAGRVVPNTEARGLELLHFGARIAASPLGASGDEAPRASLVEELLQE